MFQHNKINHNRKPSCRHCMYKKGCDKKYETCNKNTGFETPCNSCITKEHCNIKKLFDKHDKVIYECQYWKQI